MANTLRQFMQRSAALQLYRDLLRTAKKAPKDTRQAIQEEARRQFEADRHVTSGNGTGHVDFLVSKGQEKLSQLRKMLMLTQSKF